MPATLPLKEKPVRILMLLENESYPEDCRVLLEAESLSTAGYQVTVICPTDQTGVMAELVGPVRVYRYPKPFELGGFLGYLWEYAYSLTMLFVWACFVWLRRGFDVVHVHTPPDMTAVIAIFFKLLGKKFVFDHHDLSPELFDAQKNGRGNRAVIATLLWFERLAVRWADRLIATNLTQQDVQIQRCGAKSENCYVVRNGPNQMFLADVEPQILSNADSAVPVIGYVGVIGIQDGVDFLIEALKCLKHEEAQKFKAVIVGAGPALPAVQQLAESHGLTEDITFTGMIPFSQVPAHIAAFDICATPDPSNAYNDSCTTIKTMEYMALRKPTVCFETLENQRTAGDSALYALNNDVGAFASALKTLANDAGLRQRMGQHGRELIEAGLTWEHQAKNLVALYDDLFDFQRFGADWGPDQELTQENPSDLTREVQLHE